MFQGKQSNIILPKYHFAAHEILGLSLLLSQLNVTDKNQVLFLYTVFLTSNSVAKG